MVRVFVHPVSMVGDILPVGWRLAVQQRANAASLHVVRDGQPGEIQKGRGKIHIATNAGATSACLDFPGIPDQKRHLKRLLIDESLVEPSMFAKKKALIRCIYHDRVVG